VFSPATAKAGTHTLTYAVQTGGCLTRVTKRITVSPAPAVTLAPLNPVSVTAAPFALTGGSPAGGTYTGMGVVNGQFNPALVGPGSYTVTYTVNGGCEGRAQQTMVVNPVLAAPSGLQATGKSASEIALTWADNSLSETGVVVERAATAGGPYTAVATLAANTTAYTDQQLTPKTTYHYRVKFVSGTTASSAYSNGASATTLAADITSAPNGLHNVFVKLYPNPTSGAFLVEYSSKGSVQKVTVQIYNALGMVVQTKKVSGSGGEFKESFDVSSLARGVYFVRVIDNGQMYLKRLVKE
jgi:hypothetical protein